MKHIIKITPMHALRKCNDHLVLILAAIFVSIWCVWGFLLFSLLPLFWPSTMNVVQFISSGVLQLVALPLLAYTNNLDTKETSRILQETHDSVMTNVDALHIKHDTLHTKLNINSKVKYSMEELSYRKPLSIRSSSRHKSYIPHYRVTTVHFRN